MRMLKDCQDVTKVFLDSVSLLGEKLGVLLLQSCRKGTGHSIF
ncbi:MAG: hypothetical protein IMZ61_05925 [Planctomycetes bacterium]|nr:hypothetical protein [Planctomycetota bacterium]